MAAGLNLMNAPPSLSTMEPQVLVSDTEASCAKTVANKRGQRSSGSQSKVTGSSSSEDERKSAGSKKRYVIQELQLLI